MMWLECRSISRSTEIFTNWQS